MPENNDEDRFNKLPLPSLLEDEIWRQQRLQKFIKDWDNVPTLVNFFGSNTTLANSPPLNYYHAIDYMFYEHLQSLFCDDIIDVYQLSAIALGEALVHHLDFRWCRSTLFPNNPLQVYHEPTNKLLDLPSWIANIRERNHDMVMTEVFTGILAKLIWNFFEYHWLLACVSSDWSEQQQLERFGICPSASLRRLIRLAYYKDEELLIYAIGYDDFLPNTENFYTHLDYFTHIESTIRHYFKYYGDDWEAETAKQYSENNYDLND